MSYKVVAPLIGVNGVDGKLLYLYGGADVPEKGVAQGDLDRLEAEGLIAKESTPRGPVKKSDA